MKSPLDLLLEETADVETHSDAESRRLLEAAGIDVDAACRRLQATITQRGAALRRTRMDEARRQREQRADDGLLATVRQMALPIEGLIARITQLEGQAAHRDFREWSKEDLESELADLLALEERVKAGANDK